MLTTVRPNKIMIRTLGRKKGCQRNWKMVCPSCRVSTCFKTEHIYYSTLEKKTQFSIPIFIYRGGTKVSSQVVLDRPYALPFHPPRGWIWIWITWHLGTVLDLPALLCSVSCSCSSIPVPSLALIFCKHARQLYQLLDECGPYKATETFWQQIQVIYF